MLGGVKLMLIKNSRILRTAGFTVVEVSIGLGLMALGGLALLATSDYFMKSQFAAESRAAHTNLRNLIQMALSQRVTIAGVTTNACKINLQAMGGGAPVIPGSILNGTAPITVADQLKLGISLGGMPIAVSGNVPNLPNAQEMGDHLNYEILLTGRLKSKGAITTQYSGTVEIIGHRTLQFGRTDTLTASIPIDFSVKTVGGALDDCIVRPTDRVISGGLATVDQCFDKGGLTIPSSVGNLCRFRLPPTIVGPIGSAAFCPDAFVGDPLASPWCTLDPSADSPRTSTIPACPTVPVPTNGCANGTFRTAPGVGTCTPCTTPAILATGVTYTSGGDRTAPTDCAIAAVPAPTCTTAGFIFRNGACLPPLSPGLPSTTCNLTANILVPNAPPGGNPNGGSISVGTGGNYQPVLASDFTITPNVGARIQSTPTEVKFINLPQGDYVITVTNPLATASVFPSTTDCRITLQQTLRTGGFFVDTTRGQGSLFCNYQGFPGGTDAPLCPDDPDWNHVSIPRDGWDEIAWDSAANLRKCQYTFQCTAPDIQTVLLPPYGDGVTPACIRAIIACPEPTPAPPPGSVPWLTVSNSPLTCRLNTAVTITTPPPPFQCSAFGFRDPLTLDPQFFFKHQELNVWKDVNHILCL